MNTFVPLYPLPVQTSEKFTEFIELEYRKDLRAPSRSRNNLFQQIHCNATVFELEIDSLLQNLP